MVIYRRLWVVVGDADEVSKGLTRTTTAKGRVKEEKVTQVVRLGNGQAVGITESGLAELERNPI